MFWFAAPRFIQPNFGESFDIGRKFAISIKFIKLLCISSFNQPLYQSVNQKKEALKSNIKISFFLTK